MSDRWWGYFEEQLNSGHWLATAISHWQFMQPLYGAIQASLPTGGRILNVGCGLGFSEDYFAALGYYCTGVDNESRVIELAREVASSLKVAPRFELGDAFNLSMYHGQYDLAYSTGVLEHFDRDVTIKLLQEQARCAELVLISIPTGLTKYTGSITDERIYPMHELKNIVKDAGLDVVRSFGFGDVSATALHLAVKRVLPYGLYRIFQNHGYGYSIAVVGRRRG